MSRKRDFVEVLKSMQPGETVIYDGEELRPEGPTLEQRVFLLANHYLRLEERVAEIEALVLKVLPKENHHHHEEEESDHPHFGPTPPEPPKEDPSYR